MKIRWLIVLCFLLIPASAFAQATVASTPTVTGIPHAGVDVTTSAYYSSQTDANYFSDPGMEWPQFGQAIGITNVIGSPVTGFTAINTVTPSGEPSNFWTGTNICTVRVGVCSDSTNNYCINNSNTVAGGGCSSSGTCSAGSVFSVADYNSSTLGSMGSYSSGTSTINVTGLPDNLLILSGTPFLVTGDTTTYTTTANFTSSGSGAITSLTFNPAFTQNESSGTNNLTFGIQTFTCSGDCPTLAGPASAAGGNGNVADVVGCRVVVTNPQSWPNLENNWGAQFSGWYNNADFTHIFLQGTNAYQGDAALEINASSTSPTMNFNWDGGGSGSSPAVCSANHAQICTQDSDCSTGTCLLTSETGGSTLFADHPITGSNWVFSFWGTSAASGMSCTATLQRSGQSDMLNHTFTIAQSSGSANGSQGSLNWTQYSAAVTPLDTSATTGQLEFNFNCSGGTGYFDNFFLGQSTDATAFNPDTVTSIEGLSPGVLRQAPTDQTGGVVTAAQSISTNYLMPPMGSIESNGSDGTTFSYGDLTGLAAAVGASPWYTVPMAWPDSDYTTFGDQLCTWQNSYSFPGIYVECNNEDWNGVEGGYFKVGYPYLASYGLACGRAFAEIKAAYDISCLSSDSVVHYLYDEQLGNTGVMGAVQANYNFPNSSQYGISDNFYNGTGNSSATLATVIAAMAANTDIINAMNYPSNLFTDPGQLCQAVHSPACNQMIGYYEGGPSNQPSSPVSGSNLASSQANVGFAGAMIEIQSLLQALTIAPAAQAGIVTNTFNLAQNGDNGVDQWGITPGNYGLTSAFTPVYPWYRPAGLAIKLYNQALGTNPGYYPVSGLPSGIIGAVFKASGSSWTAIFANGNSSSTAVSITFPSGTVPTVADTMNDSGSLGLADNNEATSTLTLGTLSGGVSYSGQTASFTMPAYGMVALLQSGSSSPNTSGGGAIGGRSAW